MNLLNPFRFALPEIELVLNGTFDTNTANWSSGRNGVLSVSSSRLRVTYGSLSWGYGFQIVTLEVGKNYNVYVEGYAGTVNSQIRLGTSSEGTQYGGYNGGNQIVDTTITATTTNLYISLFVFAGATGDYAEFDNVSVKEAI